MRKDVSRHDDTNVGSGKRMLRAVRFSLGSREVASMIAIAFVIAAASFAGTVLVKQRVGLMAAPTGRRGELIDRITAAEAENRTLVKEIESLRERIQALEKASASGNSQLEKLNAEVRTLRFVAGLVPAYGPGIVLTLRDAQSPPNEENPQNYIVHDYDLREIVNGLMAAGAEGVAINGERISNVTSIRCVGPTILVNARRIASPFRIVAVGDPDALSDGLTRTGPASHLFAEVFPLYGIQFSVQKKARVELPRYQRELRLDYAKVVEQ
jgi:uncharacterized protein YlxW (UPF0749 family)